MRRQAMETTASYFKKRFPKKKNQQQPVQVSISAYRWTEQC